VLKICYSLILCLALLTPFTSGARSISPYDHQFFVKDLLIRLSSPVARVRLQAEADLYHHGRELFDIVADAVESGDYGTPTAALFFLIDEGGPRGLETVRGILANSRNDGRARGAAALALARKRDEPSRLMLGETLALGSWYLRACSARALGVIGNKRETRLLRRAFRQERDHRVLPEIALALYRINCNTGISYLASRFRLGSVRLLSYETARSCLLQIALEYPRYADIANLERKQQDTLLANWIYEWKSSTLPSRRDRGSRSR